MPATFAAGALCHLGEPERAREWASRALIIAPDDVTTRYNVACFHAQLGDVDHAFDLLEPLTANIVATLPANRRNALDCLEKDSSLDPIREPSALQEADRDVQIAGCALGEDEIHPGSGMPLSFVLQRSPGATGKARVTVPVVTMSPGSIVQPARIRRSRDEMAERRERAAAEHIRGDAAVDLDAVAEERDLEVAS